MSGGPEHGAVLFFIAAGIGIITHGCWCLSRGVYHAGRVRVAYAEEPVQFWFWIVFQLLFAFFMVGCGLALLLGPRLR